MFNPNELEAMPIELEGYFKELEQRIMSDVIRRVKINSEITRSADWQIYRLIELGKSKEYIKQQIKHSLELSDKEINKLYSDVIEGGYAREKSLYDSVGKEFITFDDNEPLKQLINSVANQTTGELKNITQSLGFAIKENGKLKFTPLSDYYQKTLDSAMLDITSGAFDYNTVLNRTVKEMTNSGLRTVDYATGWSNRVPVAARRAVMTGLGQITGKINVDNAKQLDTDYFEVSWHSGSRPSHQEWQGKVYSKKQLVSICGLGSVTGLNGANCNHDYYPFIPGVSERQYTDEWLDEQNKKENTPHKYNGKEYTTYEATQYQRKLETQMRAERQNIKLLQEGGAVEDDIINARAKYRATSAQYVDFSKTMDLPQQMDRVRVDGLGNIGVGKYKTNTQIFTNKNRSGIISNKKSSNTENFYEFSSGYEGNDYFASKSIINKKQISIEKQWLNSLTAQEKEAISAYCSEAYYDINSYLRKVNEFETLDIEIMHELKTNLDNAISKFNLNKNIVVFRGINDDVLEMLDLNNIVGNTFYDKGYMSTSIARVDIVQNADAIIEIQVPSGIGRGAYVNKLSSYKDKEFEFLLKRDTKCLVTGIDKSKEKLIIKMKVISSE